MYQQDHCFVFRSLEYTGWAWGEIGNYKLEKKCDLDTAFVLWGPRVQDNPGRI